MVEKAAANNAISQTDIGSYQLQDRVQKFLEIRVIPPCGKSLTLTWDKMITEHTKLRDLKKIIAETLGLLAKFEEMKFLYGPKILSGKFDD